MSSVPSPFWRPQTREPPDVPGSATKPVTATPSISAVAEPGTSVTAGGSVSTTLVSKAVEPPLLTTVMAYSRTSFTAAGSVDALPAGAAYLALLVDVRAGSTTVMSP